jgi:hypothetical protein
MLTSADISSIRPLYMAVSKNVCFSQILIVENPIIRIVWTKSLIFQNVLEEICQNANRN